VKVTIEQAMATDVIDGLYELYLTAFEPLRTRAAARHVLSAEEFGAEMLDKRIDKYVAWDDDGQPAALTTLATDLSALPWISAEYYVARYPEQSARGAVFYLGYTLVHPTRGGAGIVGGIVARIARRTQENAAVCAFDVSSHNGERQIGAIMASLGRSMSMHVDTVDVQSFHVATFPVDVPVP
jgi:hypothetical protein